MRSISLTGAAAALAAALALGAAAAPAAQARSGDAAMLEAVVLNLSAEGWAETDRATVHASIEAAFSGAQNGNPGGQDMRPTVLQALNTLAPQADWKLTHFGQVRDPAGLDRWQISAEARLPQDSLEGIRDRAEEISKPGMKVNVDHIDFSPVLSDRERLRTELRERIYADAAAELQRLRRTFPDQDFTLGQINFQPDEVQPFMARQKDMAAPRAMMMSEAAEAGGAGVNVSDRITVRAMVFFHTDPYGDDDDKDGDDRK